MSALRFLLLLTYSCAAAADYGRLPLVFEPNMGQADSDVRYLARGGGYTLLLTDNGAVMNVGGAQPVTMRLAGAQPPRSIEGREATGGISNYFLGNDPKVWRTKIPHYRKVHYEGVYPGVDVTYYGNPQQLEYDFTVAPWADPGLISVSYEGADSLRVDSAGNLVISTAAGSMMQKRPRVYQEIGGRQVDVSARYSLRENRQVKFEIASYDQSLPLVIDPVFVYATYLGGSASGVPTGIAVDSSGSAYVTGYTNSLHSPTTHAFQPLNGGGYDAFVAKISPDGSTLLYFTYLGGTGDDYAFAIAVDSAGSAYVTGETRSTNFPTVNSLQATDAGGVDAFGAKLSPDGSALIYSTYLGGASDDVGMGIAVDANGNAYLTGSTSSTNFPVVNPAQRTNAGGRTDVFVARISANGNTLLFSTYLGGNADDYGTSIAVDANGNAYVTGAAFSTNFPTVNPIPGMVAGLSAVQKVFITKFAPEGSVLYSTLLTGGYYEVGYGIAVDIGGNVYVTGETASAGFPTVNPAIASLSGLPGAFVSKISASGNSLLYSTYLGIGDFAYGYSIAVDDSGNAYVAGWIGLGGIPIVNAAQPSFGGGPTDTFVAKLSPTGNSLLFSTYIGGSDLDEYPQIAVDKIGGVYVTMQTTSTDIPTLNPLQALVGPGFVAKIFASPTTSPAINISMNHIGNFLKGQNGATYDVIVSNAPNAGNASGVLTVTSTPPSELTIVSMTGPGWNCSQSSCVRSDTLAPGTSYPPITITANIAANAPSLSTNRVTVSGSSAFATASDVAIITSPPLVFIDAPFEGTAISGLTTVRGWVLDNASLINTVSVAVDGVPIGMATYGLNRQDVCNALPGRPGCPNVGYTFQLNAAALSLGPHTITVLATDADAIADTGTASVTVNVASTVADTPLVTIDSPVPGASVSGSVPITGWAIDNATAVGTPIKALQVKVDGALIGNAAYGISRPDVCNIYVGRSGCPNVGYIFQLDTKSLSSGVHTVTVIAIDSDANPDMGSATVTVNVLGVPPVLAIDTPVSGSVLFGVVTVAGWALDAIATPGTPISAVRVRVDNTDYGNATYGISRPDVCAVYPGKPNCPNVGYTFQVDTAFMGPGSHIITVSAKDTDGNPDTAFSTVTVTVPAPLVFIDSPSRGMPVYPGLTTVSGWAIDNSTSIGSVQIKVDGISVGAATYGISRQDVCNILQARRGCPNVGFSYSLDASKLSVGTHLLTATATDTDGDAGSWSNPFQVTGPVLVWIDAPLAGSTVSGTTTVSGWVVDNATSGATQIARVQISVDGLPVGIATYGLSRPDVCTAFPGRPSCPYVGFTYTLDANTLTVGTHTLTATAIDTDGVPDSGSQVISFRIVAGVRVWIDAPVAGSTVSGTTTISGWAIDNASTAATPLTAVKVSVDGVQIGNATYGISRPDVCNALPGRPSCPNVGYTFALNTANFAHGTHVITVSATDSDSSPDSSSASVSVTW